MSLDASQTFRPAKVSKELANAAYDDFKRKVSHQTASSHRGKCGSSINYFACRQ